MNEHDDKATNVGVPDVPQVREVPEAPPAPDTSMHPTPKAPMTTPGPSATHPPVTLVGPTLRVYGALLWSFVIAGQFTTSWIDGAPLPEGLAVVFVLATTGAVGALAMWGYANVARPSRLALARRSVLVFLLALAVGALSVFAVSVGSAFVVDRRSLLPPFVLVMLALVASIVGQRTQRAAAPSTHTRRVAGAMAWLVTTVLTLIAAAELIASG